MNEALLILAIVIVGLTMIELTMVTRVLRHLSSIVSDLQAWMDRQ